MALAVTGLGVVCAAGTGLGALAQVIPHAAGAAGRPGGHVAGLYAEPLPSPSAHALVEFDARRLLGRLLKHRSGMYGRKTLLCLRIHRR